MKKLLSISFFIGLFIFSQSVQGQIKLPKIEDVNKTIKALEKVVEKNSTKQPLDASNGSEKTKNPDKVVSLQDINGNITIKYGDSTYTFKNVTIADIEKAYSEIQSMEKSGADTDRIIEKNEETLKTWGCDIYNWQTTSNQITTFHEEVLKPIYNSNQASEAVVYYLNATSLN